MEQLITDFIVKMATQYPFIILALASMGTFRALLKPTFTWLRTVTQATETKKDDELLNKVESSKFYKGVVFILDYLFSIKLIK